MTLKIGSQSSKANQALPLSQWCIAAYLVRIHRSVLQGECSKGQCLQSKLHSDLEIGHQNLIKSFAHLSYTIHQLWFETIYWFNRYGADKFFSSNFQILSAPVTLRIRLRSPKRTGNHFFPLSQYDTHASKSESSHRFTREQIWNNANDDTKNSEFSFPLGQAGGGGDGGIILMHLNLNSLCS